MQTSGYRAPLAVKSSAIVIYINVSLCQHFMHRCKKVLRCKSRKSKEECLGMKKELKPKISGRSLFEVEATGQRVLTNAVEARFLD